MAETSSGDKITVADRLEILDLLAVYNWALDTDDADGFVSTFTDDGEFVTPRQVFKGQSSLRELAKYLLEKREQGGPRSHFHNVSNVVLRGDREEVRFVAQLIGPRTADDGGMVLQLGWYDDIIRNTPQGWRFARRHFREWPEHKPSRSPVGVL
ncbi:nuclear transport factor 2 family protein [Amycolatopsis pithecellobii]|uniref:SnoaL-like domain-containing protein n=1 Tax=Amycolatopsis pithecellobii TaxID=664692 RepID=A0A6N7Z904_9PSEU|nr:nuclear transport factor 2 family protein [Amycolatopsis pithecellobii]MTD57606.1 hypothetical protein [Amycolatopsis pithecellobii]